MDEEESTDTFRVELVLIPCLVMALFINYQFSIKEILWSFSIFLEAVAILPQFHMLKRTGQAEALTRYYIFALGSYRGLYILNWIYRYAADEGFDPISVISGIVQTSINFYFIYVYWKKYPREIDIESPPDLQPSSVPVPQPAEASLSTEIHPFGQDSTPSAINAMEVTEESTHAGD